MRLIEQTKDQRQCHRMCMTELYLMAQLTREGTPLRWSTYGPKKIVSAYARTGDAYLTPDTAHDHLLNSVDTNDRPILGHGRSKEHPWYHDLLNLLTKWLCSDQLTVQLSPTNEDDGVIDIRLGQGCLLASDDDSESRWIMQELLDDMPKERTIEIDALKLVMWIYGSYPTEVIENPIKTFNDEFEASIGNEGLDPESRLGRMSQEEFLAERTAAEIAGTLTSKFSKAKSRTTIDVARDILQEFGDTFRLSDKAMQYLGATYEEKDPRNMTWVRSSTAE